MASVSPWLVLVALGAFHGLNPAMGWLFAVALGLHRNSRRSCCCRSYPSRPDIWSRSPSLRRWWWRSALSSTSVVLEIGAGLVLLGWAAYSAVYGHRHRVRVGMTTGMVGLGVWSFFMATAHGAGLMLTPALISLCLDATPAGELTAAGSLPIALAAIGVHAAAMLAVTLAIAVSVYEWLGLSVLRRGWINFDFIWIAALAITGAILIA